MVETQHSDDALALVTPALRLTFRWAGDRWTHCLETPDRGGAWSVRATSLEADEGRDDPARVVSPTFQEVQLHHEGQSGLALALGRFGPHHFSASFKVEVSDDTDTPTTTVRVDVADRCRGPIEGFAATYTVHAPPGDLQRAAPTGAHWTFDDGRHHLTLEADSLQPCPARIVVGEAGRSACRAQAVAELVAGPATQRLVYEWRRTDESRQPKTTDALREV